MSRRDFLRKYFVKFAVALTLVGIIVYTVYHAIGSSSGSLMTTPARSVTDSQILGGEAYLFRSEEVLQAAGQGIVNNLVESGSKVGRGTEVSEIWSGAAGTDVVAVQREVDRLNRAIAVLENSLVTVGEPISNALLYKNEANACFMELKRAVETGNFDNVTALEDEMLAYLCRYATLEGSEKTVLSTLEGLRAKKSALLVGNRTGVVNDLASGYFYDRSYVDGGESIFTEDALASLTPQSLDGLREQYHSRGNVENSSGKMVYAYDWYIATELSEAESYMTVGGSYRVVFPENGDLALTLVCEKLVSADGRTVAVLRANENLASFSYLREQRVEVEVGQCKGYYVPEQAMVNLSGIDGVYIFENNTVYFRRVDILYRGDGYCIVAEQGERGDDYLALNDIIITAGEDLYDGRVYK